MHQNNICTSISYTAWAMSVCLYANSVFEISEQVLFSSRSCSLVGIVDIGPLYHMVAIETERSKSR